MYLQCTRVPVRTRVLAMAIVAAQEESIGNSKEKIVGMLRKINETAV
jgi:hypothetical protein